MKLTKDNTITLLIDLQEKLLPAMADAEGILARSKYLLSGLDIHGMPIVSTRQYPKGLGEVIPEISELIPNAITMDKTTFSCLDTNEIRDYFSMSSRPNVLLAGIEAHICVLQTALDLISLGKNVYIVADCISSRNPFDMKIALKRMCQSGVIPTTAETALFEITQSAKAPEFKAISQLTKAQN